MLSATFVLNELFNHSVTEINPLIKKNMFIYTILVNKLYEAYIYLFLSVL
jgi:hypothetical protein